MVRKGFVALVLWLCCSTAAAQLVTFREHERQMDTGIAVGADLATFFGNVDGAGFAFFQPTPMVSARLGEAVLEGALPFAYFHENNDPGADHNQLAIGNPWLALAYLPDCSCGLSRLSLGIAPNLASASTPRRARALSFARAVHGDWDGYLWREQLLPLVLGASTRKELSRIRLAWDGDLIVGLPGNGREVEIGGQTAGELALLFGWNTSFAARISAAYYPTLSGDPFQSALTFYLRYMRTRDSFGARFVMNLDGPAGFSFADQGVWGLALFYDTSF